MMFNCRRCAALAPEYVNSASGLDLHRCHWLAADHEGGSLPNRWKHLVDVQPAPQASAEDGGPILLHRTLGGPWFRQRRTMGGALAAQWFGARDDALSLWD